MWGGGGRRVCFLSAWLRRGDCLTEVAATFLNCNFRCTSLSPVAATVSNSSSRNRYEQFAVACLGAACLCFFGFDETSLCHCSASAMPPRCLSRSTLHARTQKRSSRHKLCDTRPAVSGDFRSQRPLPRCSRFRRVPTCSEVVDCQEGHPSSRISVSIRSVGMPLPGNGSSSSVPKQKHTCPLQKMTGICASSRNASRRTGSHGLALPPQRQPGQVSRVMQCRTRRFGCFRSVVTYMLFGCVCGLV